MPSRDNHVLMTLKLGQWSNKHNLRAFEIEREVAANRQRCTARRRARRFSLGNLKLHWTNVI
ncbi:hypothetical protein [Ruegeria sp. HKCCA5426]|uniref:hypothetical protein n=1 Tax=Ruegeria sp. HKCCA5426 TaxID=2682985 RepID=UPI00148991E9|nr:hypothetical protein [Ruegeria sp. HKCCA5426]